MPLARCSALVDLYSHWITALRAFWELALPGTLPPQKNEEDNCHGYHYSNGYSQHCDCGRHALCIIGRTCGICIGMNRNLSNGNCASCTGGTECGCSSPFWCWARLMHGGTVRAIRPSIVRFTCAQATVAGTYPRTTTWETVLAIVGHRAGFRCGGLMWVLLWERCRHGINA